MDFSQQWIAATVIQIPKPNRDYTDPCSYRPIALTICLCKVLERIINTRFISYLEKYMILDGKVIDFIENILFIDSTLDMTRQNGTTLAQWKLEWWLVCFFVFVCKQARYMISHWCSKSAFYISNQTTSFNLRYINENAILMTKWLHF